MITWELSTSFLTKSNGDFIMKAYSDKEIKSMIKNITDLKLKTRNENKRRLLYNILQDLYLIHYTQR